MCEIHEFRCKLYYLYYNIFIIMYYQYIIIQLYKFYLYNTNSIIICIKHSRSKVLGHFCFQYSVLIVNFIIQSCTTYVWYIKYADILTESLLHRVCFIFIVFNYIVCIYKYNNLYCILCTLCLQLYNLLHNIYYWYNIYIYCKYCIYIIIIYIYIFFNNFNIIYIIYIIINIQFIIYVYYFYFKNITFILRFLNRDVCIRYIL